MPQQAHLIGGGIASLAAAAHLIRDGGFTPEHIHIYEAGHLLGGSLDGAGSPEEGYVIRGGRMFNFSYLCTYELLSFIPSLADAHQTVRDEFAAFNEKHRTHSRARLVAKGRPVPDTARMGFGMQDRLDMIAIALA